MNGTLLTGSEIVMESLLRQQVHTIFGYPGGSVIPLYDIMYKNMFIPENSRHILVRHEQASAFAANAMGRVTGKAGYVLPPVDPGQQISSRVWRMP